LIDVPVLITNFVDSKGKFPNADGLDFDNSRLVHRFFISETISGINTLGGYLGNAPPNVIRIAKSVKLRVQEDTATAEQIKRPVLLITYEEVPVSYITQGSTSDVSFLVDYY
jgi:hypothetical protein